MIKLMKHVGTTATHCICKFYLKNESIYRKVLAIIGMITKAKQKCLLIVYI